MRRLSRIGPVVIGGGLIAPLAVWVFMAGSTQGLDIDAAALAWPAIGRASLLATYVSVLSALVGVALALMLPCLTGRMKNGLRLVLLTPLATGMLARNYTWSAMLAAASSDNSPEFVRALANRVILSEAAVVLVMVFAFLPWTYYVLDLAASVIEPLHWESAACCGASSMQAYIRLHVRVIVAACPLALALVFVSALGFFITPAMLGRNDTFGIGALIVHTINVGDFASAVALSRLFLLVALLPAAAMLALCIRPGSILARRG